MYCAQIDVNVFIKKKMNQFRLDVVEKFFFREECYIRNITIAPNYLGTSIRKINNINKISRLRICSPLIM